MRSCSTCGKPFEPGDRSCARCGRSRSTPRLSTGDHRSGSDDARWRPGGDAPGLIAGATPRPLGSPAPVAFGPPTGSALGLVRQAPPSPPVFPATAGSPAATAAGTPAARTAAAGALEAPVPPWERVLDVEPAWEELVGPDGEAGHDAGAEGDVAVGRRGVPWRWLLAGLVLAGLLAAGLALAGRSNGASALVGDVGVERPLPRAVTQVPSLRWRARGLGSSVDEAANGGGGGLVVVDETHVYAVPGDGGNLLTALDLVTGTTAWTAPLEDVTSQLYVIDGAVVTSTDGRIVAYDAATGLKRWDAAGQFVYQPWSGGPLVAGRFGDGAPVLAVLDPVTGNDRWVTTTAATGNWWGDRSGLFWPTCSGVQRLDWLDGRVRWSHPTGTDVCTGRPSQAVAVAGSTVVMQLFDRWVGVDIATGAEQWTAPREDDTGFDTMVALDRGHLAVTQHRQSDADRVRVLDVATGELTSAEIDGHFEILRVRQGDHDQLYAFNGTSLRSLDRSSYAVVGPSVPMEGFLPSPLGDRAMATDTTYALNSADGVSELSAYSLSTGTARWHVDVPVGARLIAVGKVLVLLDSGDLVAFG